MIPAQRAAELCRARGGNFLNEFEAHLQHGFVFSSAEAFIMGRPVKRGADMSDVWRTWPEAQCDAWFVWCAVGSAFHVLEMMPRPLPWCGWVRQERDWTEEHWVPTHLLRRRLKKKVAVSTALV